MRNPILLFTLLSLPPTHAQVLDGGAAKFTRADTLRGSIGPERAWWNVTFYDVSVKPDLDRRSIAGVTAIAFTAVAEGRRMQIDLQQPLVADSVTVEVQAVRDGAIAIVDRTVPFMRDGDVLWVDLPDTLRAGEATTMRVHYHGVPRAAKNPPWDGGWIWRRDESGAPWVSVACQGLGASVWYPCKDHQSDEPDDGAALHITVPDSLQAVGNGRWRGTTAHGDGTSTWHWRVTSPINTYNLVPSIGRYAHFSEVYMGLEGPLDCDYWVLAADEARAREQFKQVAPMLACFEQRFGPYPFRADGYKLVASPHLGMEHQSAVAYGNGYQNGYLGRDLSGTGVGLKWDFILVHESGHEWFGNSITTADIADMWVHEGFTHYSETIFTECQQGREAAERYVTGCRRNIANDRPIIGPYGVNEEGSGDMYYKGAALLHMVRHIVGDSTFFAMLLEMDRRYRHRIVTSAEIEDFLIHFDERTPTRLNRALFDQYLRTTQVPELQWGVHKRKLWVRWAECVPGLRMPVRVRVDGRSVELVPGTDLSMAEAIVSRTPALEVDRNWYVGAKHLTRKELDRARRSTLVNTSW
ncbi:MAG: M1 family metallopeptidase [Flavobacteriales bacterium]|nr:M1 family metallopeptidase [Flavobacteriales bacterium]